ncbi:MAG: RHS repeat-associated core domain-containing protein [Armatimonadota bacterium]
MVFFLADWAFGGGLGERVSEPAMDKRTAHGRIGSERMIYPINLEHNDFGARVSKSDSSGSNTYLRGSSGLIGSIVSDSAATYTPGVSEKRGTTSTYYHADIKNSVEQTSTGQGVAASKQYDAFGNEVSSSGPWQGPFQYGGAFGYHTDSDYGLKHLGARYYDSTTGRFLSRDPIGDGSNWYAYCYANPLNLFDATGLEPAPAEFAPEALLPDGRRTEGIDATPWWQRALHGTYDFVIGFGDGASFGLSGKIRDWINPNLNDNFVDFDSWAYRAGRVGGQVVGSSALGGFGAQVGVAWWRADPTKPVKLLGFAMRFRKSTPRFGGRRAVSFDWRGRQVGRIDWSPRHGWHWNTPDGRHIPIRLPRPDPFVLPLDDHAREQERSVPTFAPVVGGP